MPTIFRDVVAPGANISIATTYYSIDPFLGKERAGGLNYVRASTTFYQKRKHKTLQLVTPHCESPTDTTITMMMMLLLTQSFLLGGALLAAPSSAFTSPFVGKSLAANRPYVVLAMAG